MAKYLVDDLDEDKVVESVLALLSLTLHDEGRVWKGLDWGVMALLHERGWIVDPRSKAKSVLMTEEGQRQAAAFLQKYFGRPGRAD